MATNDYSSLINESKNLDTSIAQLSFISKFNQVFQSIKFKTHPRSILNIKVTPLLLPSKVYSHCLEPYLKCTCSFSSFLLASIQPIPCSSSSSLSICIKLQSLSESIEWNQTYTFPLHLQSTLNTSSSTLDSDSNNSLAWTTTFHFPIRTRLLNLPFKLDFYLCFPLKLPPTFQYESTCLLSCPFLSHILDPFDFSHPTLRVQFCSDASFFQSHQKLLDFAMNSLNIPSIPSTTSTPTLCRSSLSFALPFHLHSILFQLLFQPFLPNSPLFTNALTSFDTTTPSNSNMDMNSNLNSVSFYFIHSIFSSTLVKISFTSINPVTSSTTTTTTTTTISTPLFQLHLETLFPCVMYHLKYTLLHRILSLSILPLPLDLLTNVTPSHSSLLSFWYTFFHSSSSSSSSLSSFVPVRSHVLAFFEWLEHCVYPIPISLSLSMSNHKKRKEQES